MTARTGSEPLVRHLSPGGTAPPDIVYDIPYSAPLDWDSLLRFLGGRAAAGVEYVEDRSYLRTVRIATHRAWLSVKPDNSRPVLRVRLSAALAPVLQQALSRVERLFDLST